MEALEAPEAALWLSPAPREPLVVAHATASSRCVFYGAILVCGIVVGEVAWLSTIVYVIHAILV